MTSLRFLTGGVDKRTLEKYEREAKERNRESVSLTWAMDTSEEERSRGITVEVSDVIVARNSSGVSDVIVARHSSGVSDVIVARNSSGVSDVIVARHSSGVSDGIVAGVVTS